MLERRALLGLAEQLQGIGQTLGQMSSTHHAEDTDAQRISKMLEQLKAWDHGSNVKPDAGDGGAPMVAIDAPAGIAAMSQDALVLGAQSHIDAVSVGNTQISAGRRLLQLLPSMAYGNGWLQVQLSLPLSRDQASKGSLAMQQESKRLDSWPKNGDPYEEIYKVKGKWYSLIKEEWINPSDLPEDRGGGTFARTCKYLDDAREFHKTINGFYHDISYAHYGVDPERKGWGNVIWQISGNCADPTGWESWPILADTDQGSIDLVAWTVDNKAFGRRVGASTPAPIRARMLEQNEAGDKTVPKRSADDQLNSGKFKGVFRQAGYEHQDSYEDRRAVASTLYSVVRIAQQAKWKD